MKVSSVVVKLRIIILLSGFPLIMVASFEVLYEWDFRVLVKGGEGSEKYRSNNSGSKGHMKAFFFFLIRALLN